MGLKLQSAERKASIKGKSSYFDLLFGKEERFSVFPLGCQMHS